MRHVHVEHVMGMPVSFDLRDIGGDPPPGSAAADALAAAVALLHHVDATFSTYRADSEISRLARGELPESEASPEVREVLERCEDLRVLSGGCFDLRATPAGAPTRLDPSGYVKGWATEAAAEQLRRAGLRNFCVNAGGDLVARGRAQAGRAWRVGIRDPWTTDHIAGVVVAEDLAVATSATYERGEHIIDPRTGRPPRGVASMTVVGPRLSLADAYATAAFVMGLEGLAWVEQFPGHAALAITDDRRVVWTPAMDRYLDRG